ncbi:hypothetical protein [Methylocaldum sp.]|uniref:hypothetical protein n=1 Tax=Methylocaldum sp. TaxID=1969727 RepID=UPI002D5B27BE|nr:hypothetical protein [Methylocaldum sp.]HYE38205.1 hypothetical protein [Methylocaldum sp.]
MSDNTNTSSGGIGLLGSLGLLLIGLKLVGVIDWPWWWVLLPLYGPVVAVLFLAVVIVALDR